MARVRPQRTPSRPRRRRLDARLRLARRHALLRAGRHARVPREAPARPHDFLCDGLDPRRLHGLRPVRAVRTRGARQRAPGVVDVAPLFRLPSLRLVSCRGIGAATHRADALGVGRRPGREANFPLHAPRLLNSAILPLRTRPPRSALRTAFSRAPRRPLRARRLGPLPADGRRVATAERAAAASSRAPRLLLLQEDAVSPTDVQAAPPRKGALSVVEAHRLRTQRRRRRRRRC
mmetsp:Transcript_5153/g.16200  ORF Transcript_5153/g.16200 Transcript_5153/m.16200 type:complete len:234 (+) Transcript_5153:1176-1877(+)